MKTNNLDFKLKQIIERKHKELNLGRDYSKKFSKIKDFEGNAIGQIGEEFVKGIISEMTDIYDDGVIHNEYDIKTVNEILFEVKTARQGRDNTTFQFNGINPNYNYNYLICIGICEDKVLYRMFEKNNISYQHSNRKFYIKQGDLRRQLVQMNPQNQVNYKLTLNIKHLYPINNLVPELKTILNK